MRSERYQRHSLIDWFPEESLKGAHFAVIGAGAVGNEVLKNLALLGVGKVDVFDLDLIELHNLTRSVLFRESDVGRSKAECAAARLKELDSSIDVAAFHGDFWEHLTLASTQNYTALICCVDNFEARIKANKMALLTASTLINVGIDSRYISVEIFPFGNLRCACFECNLPNSVYDRIRKRYSCGWLRRRAINEQLVPTTVVTASAAGALAVSSALHMLTQHKVLDATRVLFDTISGKSTVTALSRFEQCITCGYDRESVSILRSQPEVVSCLADLAQLPNLRVVTSDQIITRIKCKNCDPEFRVLFDRASHHDESLTFCEQCGEDSIEVEIKDEFTINELLTHYSSRKLPAKYVICHGAVEQYCIEFREESR